MEYQLVTFLLNSDSQYLDVAIFIGRIAFGVCFFVHGLGKLGLVGPGNMQGFEGWLKSLGVPMPKVSARMAMLSEVVGGVFLATGLFMRPACIILLFTMLVAAATGHRGGGYLITNNPPGNEYALNLCVILVMFLLLGPGTLSLDYFLFF